MPLKASTSIWLSVHWFSRAVWGYRTSAVFLTLVLEREAQLSADAFLRTKTLEKKKKVP